MTTARAPHSAVRIDQANARGDAALIAYLPVGFPTVEASVRAGKALADAGVDAIELGFPYSDPGMDGPTIQRATVAALERGTHIEDLFHAVDELTAHGVATMVMTYWNPVEWWGVERFAADFAGVGGSGLITPDLPPEEGAQWEAAADANGLERVYLSAPSSPARRLALIAAHSRGWVYAASSMGVTGARASVGAHVRDVVERLAGFGFTQVDPVETASEDIRFSLPKNLRADLKATGIQPDRPHKVRERVERVGERTERTDVSQ